MNITRFKQEIETLDKKKYLNNRNKINVVLTILIGHLIYKEIEFYYRSDINKSIVINKQKLKSERTLKLFKYCLKSRITIQYEFDEIVIYVTW